MKFIRLNDHEIRCVLSEEELNFFGIDLDDIIEKKGKSRRFFQALLEQAGKALGLKGASEIKVASAQISVLEDKSISIVFHEVKRELSTDVRREILNMMEEQLKIGGNDSKEAIAEIRRLREELREEEEEAEEREAAFGVRFMTLEHVMQYVRAVAYRGTVMSKLYKDRRDDSYILFIMRDLLNQQVFKRLLVLSEEYGRILPQSSAGHAFAVENSDPIIEDDAFAILNSMLENTCDD